VTTVSSALRIQLCRFKMHPFPRDRLAATSAARAK
jgi:hypothetical protein